MIPGICLFYHPGEDRMHVNNIEKETLRDLGKKILEISADPSNKERIKLWKKVNSLHMVRPPVFIFEIPWHEMNYLDELKTTCSDPFFMGIERSLRRCIYQWNHLPGDMVVEGYIECPMAIKNTGTGISENTEISVTDKDSDIFSRRFNVQIESEEDIEKIGMPVITHDEDETDRRLSLLTDIFGGVMPVRKKGFRWTSVSPWDELVRLTGVDRILLDMATRPEYVHKAISRMTDSCLFALKQYNELNLLELNNDNTYLGGGLQYTDDLPCRNFNPSRIRPSDMWGRTMSQVFSAVSPAMHDEFALRYEMKYLGQFGLVYYGCCEPLHKKIGILRKIPNLRKISMSPWVNAEEGAEAIGRDYVYSMKPNPAFLGRETWDPCLVRKDMKENMEKTRNCAREIILKDISTVRYQPERLWEWASIAREVALNC